MAAPWEKYGAQPAPARPWPGMITQGTSNPLDYAKYPKKQNPDGSWSHIKTASFNLDGREVLLPTMVGGKDLVRVKPDRSIDYDPVIDHYRKTGDHFGIFSSPDAVQAYATNLENSLQQPNGPWAKYATAQSTVSTVEDSAARGLPPLTVRQRGPFGMREVLASRVHPRGASLGDVAEAGGAMLTGVAGSIPGIPGNVEALGRLALSPMGASRETVLPTSADVQNTIAGPAPNELVEGWRQVGDIFGPGIWAALARGVGNIPSAIGSMAGKPDPNVAALAQRAQTLGVPIRPGQASSSRAVKVVDDQLAALPPSLTGSSAKNPTRITPDAQFEAFTRAVSRTVGEDEPALTPTVMATVQKKISDIYETVLPRNQVAPTPALATALDDIKTNAVDALDEDSVKPVLHALRQIEKKMAKAGALTGRQYQTMRAKGGMISAVSDSQNSTVAFYGAKIRDALDDAFEAQAQGDDGAAIKQAREWFRNYKILEPLAEKAPTGKISPALLLGQVAKAYPDFATGGGGDIADLARIGQQFLKSPPNSETATRSWVMRTLENPGAALAKTAASPVIGTVGRAMNAGINSPAAASRLFANPLQNAVVPGGGANIPAIDPRLLAMMSPAALAALLAPRPNTAP